MKANNLLLIKRPKVTEKSSLLSEVRGYTFLVDMRATKGEVREIIKELYKVTPVKINMTTIPRKTVLRGATVGRTAKGKKAIVYLKEGDKIEFV